MSYPVTLSHAIDTISKLPLQQQEMLLDILQHRLSETRRQGIADAAQQARADFQQGQLKAETADVVIQDLHQSLADER